MDKIKESYFNLLMIASSIRQYWLSKVQVESFLNTVVPDEFEMEIPVSMEEVRKNFDQQCLPMKGFIVIQTCAFLDEYKLLFKMPPNDDKAIELKKGLKTILHHAISFIETSWKDLYTVRNSLLAHNWRQNGLPVMFSSASDNPSNIPWTDEEFTLLIGIFDSIIAILKAYQPEYFEELQNTLVQKSFNKVHHLTRSQTHDQSLELVHAIDGLMKLELEHLKATKGSDGQAN